MILRSKCPTWKVKVTQEKDISPHVIIDLRNFMSIINVFFLSSIYSFCHRLAFGDNSSRSTHTKREAANKAIFHGVNNVQVTLEKSNNAASVSNAFHLTVDIIITHDVDLIYIHFLSAEHELQFFAFLLFSNASSEIFKTDPKSF